MTHTDKKFLSQSLGILYISILVSNVQYTHVIDYETLFCPFFSVSFSSISSGRSAAGLRSEMTVIMTAGRNQELMDHQAARTGIGAFTRPEVSLKLRLAVHHTCVCVC